MNDRSGFRRRAAVYLLLLSATAARADSLLDVLRDKGILTPQEHQRLESTPLPPAERAALVELLRQKGVLTPEEAQRVAGPAPSAPARAEAKSATAPSAVAMPQVGYDEGFFVRTPDGRFVLKLGGRVATNFLFFEPGIEQRNTATIDRARLGLDATFFRYFRLRLENDFAFSSGLRDAFVAAMPSPAVNLQVGQFKVPFSYEALLSKKYQDFVERAAVVTSSVNPSRDIGVMVYGQMAGKVVQYQLAAMNGAGQNRSDNNGDKDVIGRLVLWPFARSGPTHLRGLNFGGAATYGRQPAETTKSSSGKTTLTANSIAGVTETGFTFFPAVPRSGPRWRAGTHLAWLDGPFSISGEYIRTSEARNGLGPKGIALSDLDTEGAYVGGTWMVTGEPKPFNARVHPAHPLCALDHPGIGAWELAARWEFYELSDDSGSALDALRSNRYTGALAGVNWYPNEFLRLSVNYLYGHFREVGEGRSLDPRAHAASAVLGRMQLEF